MMNSTLYGNPIAAIEAEYQWRKRRQQQSAPLASSWSATEGVYINRDTGRQYQPHNDDEARWLTSSKRYKLIKGGEGSGKSTANIISVLELLRQGMSGVLGSTDLQHFKKSLWPEFQAWCPWRHVDPSDQRKGVTGWEPTQVFSLLFQTPGGKTVRLMLGGFDDPSGWEGPNLSFLAFDEAVRHETPYMLKVADGRCRIPGPEGQPPRVQISSIPSPVDHWMYEYFGPLRDNDPFETFKRNSDVVTLRTGDNAAHLDPTYIALRASTLTATEAEARIEGEWGGEANAFPFLEDMALWDACYTPMPPLAREPMVLAMDAGISDDTFAMVGVGRYEGKLAQRFARIWTPNGGQLPYAEIEAYVLDLLKRYTVVQLCFDPFALHQMTQTIQAKAAVWLEPFNQQTDRLKADKALRDAIITRELRHDGHTELTAHIRNANRKPFIERPGMPTDGRLRIVKRRPSLKIDGAVALSMAHYRAMALNLF